MAADRRSKQLLSLCGEYAVVSEMCKHGYDASITLGNAKGVDVVVFDGDNHYRKIEVKTSRNERIVTGFFQKYDGDTESHPDYWIVVHIDENDQNHYYVMTHEEMGNVQMSHNKMNEWYKVQGVDNIGLREIAMYENRFDKINFDDVQIND